MLSDHISVAWDWDNVVITDEATGRVLVSLDDTESAVQLAADEDTPMSVETLFAPGYRIEILEMAVA